MNEPFIRIGIAEDQLLFRESIVGILNQSADMQVVLEAGNGQELLQALQAAAQRPDVILMDLSMPVMNGVDATGQIRSLYPEMRVIILSVHGEERNVARMVAIGIHGFVAKNAGLVELKKAIRSACTNGYYFNEAVMRVLQNGLPHSKMAKDAALAEQLTPREKEVLQLICREYSTKDIARFLFLSERTVEGHRNHLLEKTGAKNSAGLVVYAFRHHLVDLDL
jgi:DNA-binding NarL/FixJ family response regulator